MAVASDSIVAYATAVASHILHQIYLRVDSTRTHIFLALVSSCHPMIHPQIH